MGLARWVVLGAMLGIVCTPSTWMVEKPRSTAVTSSIGITPPIDTPDVIWASVPCENYSTARTRAKTPRNYELADSLVARTWLIIQYFQARNPALAWFVENPDASQLWSRAVARDLYPRVRLDFCCYGTPYRKRIKIACNILWNPRPLCDPLTCPSCANGRHVMSAQRGSTTSTGAADRCSLDMLHALPRSLTEEVMAICAA